MDPALSEIDQLILKMTSEKAELQNSENPHGVEQTHHDDNEEKFLDLILNEITRRDVSNPHGVDEQTHHDDNEEEFLDLILHEITRRDVSNLDGIDDRTASSIFPPLSVAGQQTTLVGSGNATSQSLSAVINQPMLLNQANIGTFTPSASGVTITYQVADQVFMLDAPLSSENCVPEVPVAATTLPTQLMDSAPPSVANSEKKVKVVATPGPSGSRKRKLYEEDEFSDPVMEKKQQNAINAKRHRDMKKQTVQSLLVELKTVKEERDALKKVNEGLKKDQMQFVQNQEEDREALVKEVEELRKEKEAMKQQLQTLEQQYQHALQQEKIGLPNIHDFNFDFNFDF